MNCTAFEGTRRIASGELVKVALKTKEVLDRGERAPVLIFDDATSELVEIDFRGTPAQVLKRLEASAIPPEQPAGDEPRGPGRPKLGVVAREVTLLPRHWEWLNAQPGGASVALRNFFMFIGAIIMMIGTSPKLSAFVLIAIPFIVLPLFAAGRWAAILRLSRPGIDPRARSAAAATAARP